MEQKHAKEPELVEGSSLFKGKQTEEVKEKKSTEHSEDCRHRKDHKNHKDHEHSKDYEHRKERKEHHKKSHKEEKEEKLKADIIVIGGGAAGCILMNKLSECGHFSVIGIEAGPNITNDPAIVQVGLPAFLLPGTAPEKFFWPGWKQTKPMPGLNGRVSDWTTGLGLGGGSSINGLYYGRGSDEMYKQWEEISESKNWSLENILKTFKELEDYHGTSSAARSEMPSAAKDHGVTTTPDARGHKGAVSILQTPTVSQLTTDRLLPATQTAFGPGIAPVVDDYNAPTSQNCIDPKAQWLIDATGTMRVSSATAFLDEKVMTPEGKGVNGHKLRVLFNSAVVRIVFDRHNRARKVLVLRKGKLVEVKVGKAVVLASGINSSKILQLSGIGPSRVLANAGIKPVFINENVGKHLQNHPTIFMSLLANPNDIGVPTGATYAFTIHNVYLPVVGGKAGDPRKIQMLFEYIPAGFLGSPVPLVVVGYDLLTPKSEGSVNIQSDNPFQIAAADDAFYQDPVDLKDMKDAVKTYIKDLLAALAAANPFPFYRPILTDPIVPVALSGFDDAKVEQYVKNNSNLNLDIHHFVSHCKMAPLKKGGVVSGDLLVHGTKNVFGADAAVFPTITDINTTGPAMMVGLRASHIIKDALPKHKCKCKCKKSHH